MKTALMKNFEGFEELQKNETIQFDTAQIRHIENCFSAVVNNQGLQDRFMELFLTKVELIRPEFYLDKKLTKILHNEVLSKPEIVEA